MSTAKSISFFFEHNLPKPSTALKQEFRNLQSCADPNNADHRSCLLEIKDLLRAMDDEAIEGCILRSKEQWTKLGEKPMRYSTRSRTRASHVMLSTHYTRTITIRSKPAEAFFRNATLFIKLFTLKNWSTARARTGF